MFHQTTLDSALHRATIAARRAEFRAMHRAERVARRRGRRAPVTASTPVACCA